MALAIPAQIASVRKLAMTQARLKELLTYNQETGLFTRNVRAGRCRSGEIAGSLVSGGHKNRIYVTICVDYIQFYAHQLAFLFVEGNIPQVVDHRDGDGTNNSWDNLRKATQTQNMANSKRRPTNKSGVKGVYWHAKDRRWMARIQVEKRQRSSKESNDRHSWTTISCARSSRSSRFLQYELQIL